MFSSLWPRLTSSKQLLAILALASTVACNLDNSTSPGAPAAYVQFVNAAPRYAAADFYFDSTVAVSDLAYGPNTLYFSAPAASVLQTIQAKLAGDTTQIASAQALIQADTFYTFVLTQHTVGGGFLILPDTVSAPANGEAAVRVVNVAPSAGAVDVYVTSPNTDLLTVSPSSSSVLFEGSSLYIPFVPSPDTARVRVTAAGTKTPVLLDVNNIQLSGGQVATILMLDATGGGTPFQEMSIEDR